MSTVPISNTRLFTSNGTFVVPALITSLDVILRGARGREDFGQGGDGGLLSGTLSVTPGETLTIRVNYQGGDGGGLGIGDDGGGAALMLRGVTTVAVAGGGGGGAPGSRGGDGGGTEGDDGEDNPFSGSALAYGGLGGSDTAGGAGGSYDGVEGYNGQNGSSLQGGGGTANAGGGGGGGYYGGGQGGAYAPGLVTSRAAGGAGGSSYVGLLTGTVVDTKGGNFELDDGNVEISWIGGRAEPTPATGITFVDTRVKSGIILLPPTSDHIGRTLIFKDQYATFKKSTLTLSTCAGDLFEDDATTRVLDANGFAITLVAGNDNVWYTTQAQQANSSEIAALTTSTIAGVDGSTINFLANTNTSTATISSLLTTGITFTSGAVSSLLYMDNNKVLNWNGQLFPNTST